MKKLIIYSIAFLIIGATFVGCKKGLQDINQNPNATTNPMSYAIFNAATKALMDNTRGSFSSARMALPWIQYTAQTNYTEEDRFAYRDNVNTALFRDYYTVAQNFKKIIDLNTDEATKSVSSKYGSNNNQIAASRAMLSYIFLQLVDTYGDVPYYSFGNDDEDFQALTLDNGVLTNKYASQQKIYTDLLKELKEAADMIEMDQPVFIQGDQLFGSPGKLKKFANSLRLRIANRVKGVIPGAETAIQEAITGGVMTSNEDNVGVTYQNDNVLPSPMYSAFFIDNRDDFTISKTLVDALKGLKGGFGVDPRLQKFAAPKTASLSNIQANTYSESDDLSLYVGIPYGITSQAVKNQYGVNVTSKLSYNVLKPSYTEYLMEYAEVCFLLSENKNWDDTEYKKGIRASMEKWGVATNKIDTYIARVPGSSRANVLNQKYIALFMQPYEAWAEWRRTHFPNFLLLPGQTSSYIVPYERNSTYVFQPLAVQGIVPTEIPARVNYPIQQATLNSSNYAAAAAAIGGDKVNTKLIWAQK